MKQEINREQLLKNVDVMLNFSLKNGKEIDENIIQLIDSGDKRDLIKANNALSKLVKPATVRSINYTEELVLGPKKTFYFSKLKVLNGLILLSLVFLILFIGTGLSPYVNEQSLSSGIKSNSGMVLLLNLIFIMSISGLGVVFFELKTLTQSLNEASLVPEETSYYVTEIILGIISGLLLSEVIADTIVNNEQFLFGKSVLALVGGFSSESIFSIIQSIIGRLKTAVTGKN